MALFRQVIDEHLGLDSGPIITVEAKVRGL